jgi:hypothetical protein
LNRSFSAISPASRLRSARLQRALGDRLGIAAPLTA